MTRPATARRSPVLPLVVSTVTGALLLLLAVPNIAPALRAARADGTRGTFTADHSVCVLHLGHESCSWYGAFRPAADPVPRDTTLYSAGKDALRPGQQIAAVDVGRADRVYRPSGSNEWIITAVLLCAGIALLMPLGRRTTRS